MPKVDVQYALRRKDQGSTVGHFASIDSLHRGVDALASLPGLRSLVHRQAHDAFGAMELAGRRIAWCHSHDRHQFYELEHCNYFDYLFYGQR